MRNVTVRLVRKLISPLALVLGLFLAGQPALTWAKEAWEPISAEDLAATECKAYPGSSAEVLLERQTLTTSVTAGAEVPRGFGRYAPITPIPVEGVVHHYRQVKVYSPKGADELGLFKITYAVDRQVWDVAARLTKQIGQVTQFSKKDLIETTEAKAGANKMKRLLGWSPTWRLAISWR